MSLLTKWYRRQRRSVRRLMILIEQQRQLDAIYDQRFAAREAARIAILEGCR